jgi:ribosomal protein L33
MGKKIKIKYGWTISGPDSGSKYTWHLTDKFCINCGKQTVWTIPGSNVDFGGGDCHVCQECGMEFYSWESGIKNKFKEQIKDELK